MELFALIRRDARVEGLSVRALAVKHGVHRRTVRQALVSSEPPERKPRRGVSRRLESFKPAINAMLLEDTTSPRKQRHTSDVDTDLLEPPDAVLGSADTTSHSTVPTASFSK